MKTIKLIPLFILSLSVLFLSCNDDDDDTGGEIIERPIFNLEEPDLIDDVDYEIYSLIIKERYAEKQIVIKQVSQKLYETDDSTVNDYYSKLQYDNPNIEIATVNDLITVNSNSFLFDENFVSNDKEINLLSSDERSYIFSQSLDINSNWDGFYAEYENSNGILGFSGIGYNMSKNQAVLEMARSFGSLGAYGDIIYLEKENDIWVIKTIILVWAS